MAVPGSWGEESAVGLAPLHRVAEDRGLAQRDHGVAHRLGREAPGQTEAELGHAAHILEPHEEEHSTFQDLGRAAHQAQGDLGREGRRRGHARDRGERDLWCAARRGETVGRRHVEAQRRPHRRGDLDLSFARAPALQLPEHLRGLLLQDLPERLLVELAHLDQQAPDLARLRGRALACERLLEVRFGDESAEEQDAPEGLASRAGRRVGDPALAEHQDGLRAAMGQHQLPRRTIDGQGLVQSGERQVLQLSCEAHRDPSLSAFP